MRHCTKRSYDQSYGFGRPIKSYAHRSLGYGLRRYEA